MDARAAGDLVLRKTAEAAQGVRGSNERGKDRRRGPWPGSHGIRRAGVWEEKTRHYKKLPLCPSDGDCLFFLLFLLLSSQSLGPCNTLSPDHITWPASFGVFSPGFRGERSTRRLLGVGEAEVCCCCTDFEREKRIEVEKARLRYGQTYRRTETTGKGARGV